MPAAHAAVSLLPHDAPMMAARVARSVMARSNMSVRRPRRAPAADTAVTAAMRSTRWGAASSTRWMVTPLMECPTKLKRSQPRSSASRSTSRAASSKLNSPGTWRATP